VEYLNNTEVKSSLENGPVTRKLYYVISCTTTSHTQIFRPTPPFSPIQSAASKRLLIMDVGASSFEYRALEHPDSIRLILLQPAISHDADLQCSLLHTTISHCDRDIIDKFTALSYVWGDTKDIGFIYVEQTLVTITSTLEAALRALRDPTRVLRVWADALCIDQSNFEERASQVGLMARIYTTAHHTIIYLGPLNDKAEMVLHAAPSNSSGKVRDDLTNDDIIKLAEESLLKAPWFTRVWIFQELVLSRDPWMQCGALRARWTDLCALLLSGPEEKRSKKIQVFADMNKNRGTAKPQFFETLCSRRGLGATDPSKQRNFFVLYFQLHIPLNGTTIHDSSFLPVLAGSRSPDKGGADSLKET
jgi:Heterokaryon incompatibility protein (HET)